MMDWTRGKEGSLEEIYWKEIARQLEERSIATAQWLGPPPWSGELSPEKELELWNYTLAPDAEHPFPKRIQQLEQAGASREAATLKKYPYREALYTSGRPKVVDQIAYAERMAKRSGRNSKDTSLPAQGAESSIEPNSESYQVEPSQENTPAINAAANSTAVSSGINPSNNLTQLLKMTTPSSGASVGGTGFSLE